MTSRHLHELIDACRPGHEDIDQPDFSELARELSQDPKLQQQFDRSQKLDSAIRTTFQDVTPPAGLAERLHEALESAPPSTEVDLHTTPGAGKSVESASRGSRRSWLWGATGVSLAAVAVAVTIWLGMIPPVTVFESDREIAENVDRWNTGLDEAAWQTTATIPSDDFPTWEHLDLRSVDRWQWVSKRRIVCYDFATSESTVRLFVMNPRNRSASLPATPPLGYPLPNGWHVGAWQANGRVYFLAVSAARDSKRLYSRVVASPITPA